jgi:hypothetical protein
LGFQESEDCTGVDFQRVAADNGEEDLQVEGDGEPAVHAQASTDECQIPIDQRMAKPQLLQPSFVGYADQARRPRHEQPP